MNRSGITGSASEFSDRDEEMKKELPSIISKSALKSVAKNAFPLRNLLVLTAALISLNYYAVFAQRPELYVQSGHSRPISHVAFSSDGKIVATNSFNDIKLWDVASRRELITLKPRSGFFDAIAFSPGGKFLATGGSDKTIRFWDVALGQEIGTDARFPTWIWKKHFAASTRDRCS